MSEHHGESEKKETSFWSSFKGIAIAIALLLFLIIIIVAVWPKSSSKNDDGGKTKKENLNKTPYSYTVPVEYSTNYGDPVFLPAGYDVTFIAKSTNEYCVKNKKHEACGVGDISGQLPGGHENTQGLWFKGEQAGSLDILLVKNDNL